MKEQKKYEYIKIGKHYYCACQSLLLLAWYMLAQNRRLGIHSLGVGRKHALRVLVVLTRYRFGVNRRARTLNLPFFGNLCRPVHRGHKIFDFGRRSVVKIIAPTTHTSIVSNELEGVALAGRLEFCPHVGRYNLKERWYREDYLPGELARFSHGADRPDFLERYEQDVAPCIARIALLQKPGKAGVGDYVAELTEAIARRAGKPGLPAKKIAAISDFARRCTEALAPVADEIVWQAFSHGDLSLMNVLKTPDGIAIIDWEDAAQRSLLYDLYSYFFGELFFGRAQPPMTREIEDAIRLMDAALAARAPRWRPALRQAESYRKIFYLERLRMLMERRLNAQQISMILTTLQVFEDYEAALEQRGISAVPGTGSSKPAAEKAAEGGQRTVIMLAAIAFGMSVDLA